MKNIRDLLLCIVLLFSVSCSVSAKNDKKASEKSTKGEVVMLNKADFLAKVFNYEKNPIQWIYEGDKPCIIDFYADWCPPCKQIAPILKDLAIEYKNDIIVYKINIDEEQELAAAFRIQSIPTILFVPQNKIPQMTMGALPKAEFVKQINSYLLEKD